MPVSVPTICAYELDAEFRIVSVGAQWSEFALENGAPELLPPAPFGRTLWSYISDATTMHLYHLLFAKVERTGVPLRLRLRCDGPRVRRDLELTIAPRRPGFALRSMIASAEPRPPVLLFPTAVGHEAEPMLRMCSWCKRIQIGSDWLEAEEAVRRLALFERADLPSITHGMCGACHREIQAML